MAGIGDDIRDVLQELGTPFVLYKKGTDVVLKNTPQGATANLYLTAGLQSLEITGECLDYDFYVDQSTEFIRQFCYVGDFQYDSQVRNGDVINFGGKFFLIMNVRQTLFEKLVVDYSNFFIECNTFGKFSSLTTVRGSNYKSTPIWTVIHDSVHGVQVERVGSDLNLTEKNMDISMNRFTLYTQDFPDVKVGDRWYPSVNDDSLYFKIIEVNAHRFPNMLVCKIEAEARE